MCRVRELIILFVRHSFEEKNYVFLFHHFNRVVCFVFYDYIRVSVSQASPLIVERAAHQPEVSFLVVSLPLFFYSSVNF